MAQHAQNTFQFEMSAGALAEALKGLTANAAAKVTPIFGCSLIELRGDDLSVTTGDGVMTLVRTSRVEGAEGSGAVAIPADTLAKIAATIPPYASLIIAADGEDLKVNFGEMSYDFKGLPAENFPPPVPSSGGDEFQADVSELRAAMQRVRAAVYTGDCRPGLMGINLRSCDGGVSVGACDGIVASRSRISGPAGVDLTIPLPAVEAALRHMQKDGEVVIASGKSSIRFEGPDFTLTTLVSGSPFAEYEKLLTPREGSVPITMQREDLLSSLSRIHIISGETVGIVMRAIDGRMTIKTEARALSESAKGSLGFEVVPCSRSRLALAGLTSSLLLGPLRSSTSEEITIHMHPDAIYLVADDGDDIIRGRRVYFEDHDNE